MKKYLVRDVHGEPPRERIIEAASYSYDASNGHHLFLDDRGDTVANLINVSVEPAPEDDS